MSIFAGVNDQKQRVSAVDTFTRFLQSRRLRKTPERYAILDMTMSMAGHFNIETLREKLAEDKSFVVSRATVYNTMSLLIDCGLVRRHRFAGQPAQYEAAGGPKGNHLHLVCSQCGKVREVTDAEIERIVGSRRYETFHPEYFALSIYGTCNRCLKRNRKKKREAAKSEQAIKTENKNNNKPTR